MKRAKSPTNLRTIIIIVIAIVILSLLRGQLDMRSGLFEQPFTTFSTGRQGTSLVYDTLRIMGYPVGRDIMFLSADRPTDTVQIVIAPSHFSDMHRDGMMDWVIRGGQLMFFSRGSWEEMHLFAEFAPDSSRSVPGGTIHRVGFGTVFVGSARSITNISLIENDGYYGQMIADALDTMSFRRIYFNEAYHGSGQNPTFFEILPRPLRLFGMQLVIIFVIAIIHFGRRFGRATPYYEEVEREENEYVFTLTNLYMSMGMGSHALSIYERKFMKQAADSFNIIGEPEFRQIYEHWLAEGKPSLGKLEYIIENHGNEFNTKRKKERSEFLRMVRNYKELIKELKR